MNVTPWVYKYPQTRTEDLACTRTAGRMARQLLLGAVMPATMEERLDEMLAMSRDVGRLARDVAYSEQVLASGAVRSDKRQYRSQLRDLRREHLRVTEALTGARRRFLAALPTDGGAS